MFENIKKSFQSKDIRNKILITLGLILLFTLGAYIPVPGISIEVFKDSVVNNDFLNLISSISGGALANGSILALGVGPYISASIIIQLLSIAIPSLQSLARSGEEGKKRLSLYTKICALVLAMAQAIGIVVSFSGSITNLFLGAPIWLSGAAVVIIMMAGAMFTYWLGEKITELGVSNGVSMLIFVGIISTASTSILATFQDIFAGNFDAIWTIVLFAGVLILLFALIVNMDLAERRLNIQYAKQMRGRKVYGGQSTFLPIRLMGTGVMPIIFAMTFLSAPQMIMSIFWPTSEAAIWYAQYLGAGSWAYNILASILILFFSYFYAQLSFNPEEISRQIQANGGFILGIRAGKPTTMHLKKISNRITLFGAIFLAFMVIVPTSLFKLVGGSSSLTNAFTATGMLIIVSVALEFDKQLENQLLMKNYKGFLK